MQSIQLPEELMNAKNVTDLVHDTTGLKIYGEGEWCAKRCGGKSKWVRLHVGIDQKSCKFVLAEMTQAHIRDIACLEEVLKRCNRRKGKVLFDEIADSKKCSEICRDITRSYYHL